MEDRNRAIDFLNEGVAQRQVAHKFTAEERQKVSDTINDPRFADLPPGQIVAILAEEQQYVGSEITIYRIMREEGLLNHRVRTSQSHKPRPWLTDTSQLRDSRDSQLRSVTVG